MRFNLKRPCANCPFRKEPVFYLGTARRQEIAETLRSDYNSFPCHQTTLTNDQGEYKGTQQEEHCAGAAIVLEKQGRPNILMRLAQREGKYNPKQLEEQRQIYNSLTEFETAEEADGV